MTVTFDYTYAITYKWNDARYDDKLYDIDNYAYTKERANYGSFTYHFTDVDYEYARMYGKEIE